jgi:hypothetical protein
VAVVGFAPRGRDRDLPGQFRPVPPPEHVDKEDRVRRFSWIPLAALAFAALPGFSQPKQDYSADVVMISDGKTVGTMKLYASGLKFRNDTSLAGGMIAIARRDRKLAWTVYPQKKVYIEKPLDDKFQSGEIGLNLPGVTNKEKVGQEPVLGYACTKYRLTIREPRTGRENTAYVWWADSLGLGLKSEMIGMVSEYRSLKLGPQPDSLFEVPAGYQKTAAPPLDALGIPKGLSADTMRKLQETMQKRAPKK